MASSLIIQGSTGDPFRTARAHVYAKALTGLRGSRLGTEQRYRDARSVTHWPGPVSPSM